MKGQPIIPSSSLASEPFFDNGTMLMIASIRIVLFISPKSEESIVSPILIRHRFQEVFGLRGYLALEDPTLEHIRQLQLQIDPARNVGTSASEYRKILLERSQVLGRPMNVPDAVVTLLWCSYAITADSDGNRFTQTTVTGMISYQLLIGTTFTSALVWDLIVGKPYRGAGISRHIMKECHARFRKAGVVLVYPLPPDKYRIVFQRLFQSFGYTEISPSWLEYRL